MIDFELAVGKYDCTIRFGSKDAFFGVVDGVRKRVDVVSSSLNIGYILYVAFVDAASVGFQFAQVSLQSDVVHRVVVLDAVVDHILLLLTVCI